MRLIQSTRLAAIFTAAFACAAVVATPNKAQAGFLLEPYIGYELNGGPAFKTNGGTSVTFDQKGLVLGGRVGFTVPIFFVAVDYRLTSGQMKPKDNAGTQDLTMSENQLGLVVGAHLPFFQAYAGYLFQNSLKGTATGVDNTYTGSGIKLGVGYTGLPFVAINLEYVMDSFDKIKDANGEHSLSDAGLSEAKGNTLALTVSVPLDL